MLQETDIAVLTVDLTEYGLKPGDVGTVMLVHGQSGYEVEFMTLDGETVAPLLVLPRNRGRYRTYLNTSIC